jgi:K+-sensing histidine kinase KdpD
VGDFYAVTTRRRTDALGIAIGIGLLLVMGGVLLPFRSNMSRAVPALAFVLPVVAAGLVGGRIAASVTAVAGAVVFSYSFVPPYDRWRIAVADDWVALAVFLAVALVVGTLVSVEAGRRRAAEQKADELARLHRENDALLAERTVLAEEAGRVALMERIDEQRSALLRSVSHDLRTPLATIRAVTSDLREGADFDQATRDQLLDLVGDEAERLNRIVENLLGMSRIEAGALAPTFQAPPTFQALAIDELLAERVKRLERLFLTAEVKLDASPDLPLVDADYVQLDLVVSNLLENAARHAPPGSAVRVEAHTAGDAGEMMEVVVSDEGPGVPATLRRQIFEPFQSGTGGASSGVGLAICKAVVEAHGGTIALDDTDVGASFRFSIPVHHGPVHHGPVRHG